MYTVLWGIHLYHATNCVICKLMNSEIQVIRYHLAVNWQYIKLYWTAATLTFSKWCIASHISPCALNTQPRLLHATAKFGWVSIAFK